MVCEQVSAALRAPLALAVVALLQTASELVPLRHLDVLGPPQRECVDGSGRPGAAGAAMTIAHRFRLARNLECNGSAKAATRVRSGHGMFSLVERWTVNQTTAQQARFVRRFPWSFAGR